MKERLQIAVFGSDEDHCSEKQAIVAEEVGKEIAKSRATLLTGGLNGVMYYVSKGAKENNGYVVGVLPSSRKTDANEFCDIVIPTGVGYMRGHILANSADASIVVGGGIGSRQETESTYWNFVPTIALSNSEGTASEIAGKYLDERSLTRVISVDNPKKAVEIATQLGKNRRNLETRLKSVGLDLEIFRSKPSKFIRINPRGPIEIEGLRRRLKEDYGIQTEFTETGIQGIYESSNPDIGGWIGGKRNDLFNRKYFIQDLASVICVNELGLEEGQSLLETCAARGFKSILAYDLVKGRIDITALDIDPEKYEVMLGFFFIFGLNADTHLMDATQYNGQKFDRVLVDAPCSSEGMTVSYNSELQRDVSGFDAVVQHSQQDVERFADLQGRLLQKGFEHMKDDGTLIYATCTLNREENEEVVKRFLGNNPDAKAIGVDIEGYGVRNSQSDYGVRILPEKTKGFYFAKIKRE